MSGLALLTLDDACPGLEGVRNGEDQVAHAALAAVVGQELFADLGGIDLDVVLAA